jgi:hypothetical protein
VLRFQVEMHIQCGTVEVGQVGEEKAHMAVIGGRMLASERLEVSLTNRKDAVQNIRR